jgi:hypothetical protein
LTVAPASTSADTTVQNCYFDIVVSENALAVGTDTLSPAQKGIYKGHMDLSSSNYFTRASTSYGDFTATGSPTLTEDYRSAFTSVTSSSGLGITFTAPNTGTIKVSVSSVTQPPIGQVFAVKLIETGGSTYLGSSAFFNGTSTAYSNSNIFGYLDVNAGSTYTIKLQGKSASGTGFIGGGNDQDGGFSIGMEYIK